MTAASTHTSSKHQSARWLALGLAVAVVLAAALGGLASATAAEFYAELARPVWAPPAWLFGPVWTLLYVMMAIAAARYVYRAQPPERSRGCVLFVGQLVANGLWSWLFFAYRQGLASLLCIAVLVVLIVLTARSFRRVDRWSSLLLQPYLCWVCFAAVLNATVWYLNPELLG